MNKKYLLILSVLFVLVFTFCSTDKDPFSEKPPIDIDTNKPPIPSYPGQDFTLLPKDHVPNSDLYVEGKILQNQENNPKFMLSNRRWQGIPSIGKDRLGNLYAGWISGGHEEENENYLTIAISKNKGLTWSENKLILEVNTQDSTRLKDPNFFNDKYGNLYLYWGKHVQKKSVALKEWAVTWYSKINLSNDGTTINYSPPRRISEGIMLNKPFYSKSSDQILFPLANWYTGQSNPELHQGFIYKANYGSEYLTDFRKVGFIPVNIYINTIQEHMVVQLKDDTYLGMIRTTGGIYYSKSKDGNTWDLSAKFNVLGLTTSSRFYLGKLNSGRLILIFNNAKSRTNMTVSLSDDDGVTWPYKIMIDDTADGYYGVSYPDMIETDPGVLNVVYDYIRKPNGRIYFVSIKEEDIINNQSSFFKTEISSVK
jgi:hypothetical protein